MNDANLKSKIKYFEQIQQLCLMDDEFMTVCFADDKRCAELVIRIILNKPDLIVEKVETQKTFKNIEKRAVRLDIFARDSDGKYYDIEIQRADKGANAKRARFHSAVIDANSLSAGQNFNEMPDSYVIFITENDVLGLNLPIYEIHRHIDGTNLKFIDGSHIIYVNGAMRDANTPLGELIHDFFCKNPDEMYYNLLADRTRFFKEDVKGAGDMSGVIEELCNKVAKEAAEKAAKEAAEKTAEKTTLKNAGSLLKSGKLTLNEIAETLGLSLDVVKSLAAGGAN